MRHPRSFALLLICRQVKEFGIRAEAPELSRKAYANLRPNSESASGRESRRNASFPQTTESSVCRRRPVKTSRAAPLSRTPTRAYPSRTHRRTGAGLVRQPPLL